MTLHPVRRPSGTRPKRLSVLLKSFATPEKIPEINEGQQRPQRANSMPPTRIKPLIVSVAPSSNFRRPSVLGHIPNSPVRVHASTAENNSVTGLRRRSTGRASRLSILLSGLNVSTGTGKEPSASGAASPSRGSFARQSVGGGGEIDPQAAMAAAIAMAAQNQATSPVHIPERRMSDSFPTTEHKPRRSFGEYVLGLFYAKRKEQEDARPKEAGEVGESAPSDPSKPTVDATASAGLKETNNVETTAPPVGKMQAV